MVCSEQCLESYSLRLVSLGSLWPAVIDNFIKRKKQWVNHKPSNRPFHPKEQVFLQKRKEAFTKTGFETKTNPRPMGQVHLFAVNKIWRIYLRPLLLTKGPVISCGLRRVKGKGGWGEVGWRLGRGENFDCETIKVTWSPIRLLHTFHLLHLEII